MKELQTSDADWITYAVNEIINCRADKLEKNNILVYRCGKIVRVDIKEVKQ